MKWIRRRDTRREEEEEEGRRQRGHGARKSVLETGREGKPGLQRCGEGKGRERERVKKRAGAAAWRRTCTRAVRHRRSRRGGGAAMAAASVDEKKELRGANGAETSGVRRSMQALLLARDMAAGATAAAAVEAALYPIDTIKTRLQAAVKGQSLKLTGLYAGIGGNLAGAIPGTALFFGVYEPIKRKLLEALPENASGAAHFTAASCAGIAASLIRVPTEVVKQRLQTGQFANVSAAVRGIVSKEGVRGLYAGHASFLLRDLPFDAIEFVAYEQLKLAYAKAVRRDLNTSEVAVLGAGAGAMTGALTCPFDVIKTRLMTQGSTGMYKNVFDCGIKLVREEGYAALFKGVQPRVLWISIGGSVFFTALEKSKEVYGKVLGVE